MSNLTGAMSIAVRALLANQGALETTSNNIANVNTPGYSRQRPVLTEGNPVVEGTLVFGSGVVLASIESVRDAILELRMNGEAQSQGRLDAMVAAMRQVEPMFSGSSGQIGDQLAKFFNSVEQLASDPSSMPLRQGLLTAASNLAATFRNLSNNLQAQRTNLDLSVGQVVQQINVLTSQIARLNEQVMAMENVGQNASILIDQRTVLIRQLSELVDVSVIQSDNGITLTTANGAALVAGTRSFSLATRMDSSGVQHVLADADDITGLLNGGKLGGLLAVRDQELPGLLADLDTLATGLINALNAAHRGGFDLSGDAGGDLFAPPPVTGVGAAGTFAVQITDPALVAASSDGSPGSNGNLAALSAVRDQAVAAGQNPTDFYSNLVFKIGDEVSNNSAALDASNLILRQLENQRGGISGVSLDEEAANLIRFQHAYEASARVVNTVNELLDTVINLGRY
jgi:flagellar hook-associated protein 1 FlgK